MYFKWLLMLLLIGLVHLDNAEGKKKRRKKPSGNKVVICKKTHIDNLDTHLSTQLKEIKTETQNCCTKNVEDDTLQVNVEDIKSNVTKTRGTAEEIQIDVEEMKTDMLRLDTKLNNFITETQNSLIKINENAVEVNDKVEEVFNKVDEIKDDAILIKDHLERMQNNSRCETTGYINIRGNSGEYHHVFREINSDGEVWLHFGRQGQVDWNYIQSISNLSPIVLLQQRHIDAISDFNILDYAIDTDVDFYLQADDSTNPSLLKVSRISDPATMFEIKMDRGGNHANLRFAPGYSDRIRCTGADNSNTCGQLNKPPKDQDTDPIIIWEAKFRPTDTGLGATAANANGVHWHRNKFTWNGTKYIVKIKIEDQK